MKRLSALILVLVLIVTLVACSDDTATEGKTTTTASSATTNSTTTVSTTQQLQTTTTTNPCVHKYAEQTILQEASCVKTGLAEQTCVFCFEKQTVIIPTNHNHTVVIDKAVPATATQTGLTEGKHCSVCNKVLEAQRVTPIIPPVNFTFPKGTITTDTTVIQTNDLEITVDPNVFVPGGFVETVDIVTSVMETVSGMQFSGKEPYASAKTKVTVEKDSSTECELGVAYASADGAVISSGDIVDLFALIHECTHVLQYRQSRWHHCQWAMEGITTYTTYKTQAYIQKNYPDLSEAVGSPQQSIANYTITNYSKLYEQSMDYWADHTFEYSGNVNYSIGFRLMWYLDTTHGDYTKWIHVAEKNNPYYQSGQGGDRISKEETLAAFYEAYGNDVFDKFYAWLKKNESLFKETRNTVDLRGATKMTIYPFFYNSGSRFSSRFAERTPFKYRNLYIGLEDGIRYLKDYKGKDVSRLSLAVNEGVLVEFYDSQGNVLSELQSLENVSFVRLAGEGTLEYFMIKDYQ